MTSNNQNHWDNVYSSHFDLAGSGWTELGIVYNQWLYKLRNRVFNTAIEKNNIVFTRYTKVLDIGCGTGYFIRKFSKEKVKNVVGFDLTKISIEKLNDKFPKYEFLQQNISEKLKIKTKFDFINVFDVLWYLDDYDFRKAFNNLSNLSKSGTYLFITDIFFNKGKKIGNEGMWIRSIPEYDELLNKYKFEKIGIYPIFIFSNNPCDYTYENKYFLSLLIKQWKIVYNILIKFNFTGYFFGPLFFIIDSVLFKIMRNGPSAKMMVLRKI